jgi:hypothetical protein
MQLRHIVLQLSHAASGPQAGAPHVVAAANKYKRAQYRASQRHDGQRGVGDGTVRQVEMLKSLHQGQASQQNLPHVTQSRSARPARRSRCRPAPCCQQAPGVPAPASAQRQRIHANEASAGCTRQVLAAEHGAGCRAVVQGEELELAAAGNELGQAVRRAGRAVGEVEVHEIAREEAELVVSQTGVLERQRQNCTLRSRPARVPRGNPLLALGSRPFNRWTGEV